jgi:hypothetical protein
MKRKLGIAIIGIGGLSNLAKRREDFGIQKQLSLFFKLPMVNDSTEIPVHELHRQEEILVDWLEGRTATAKER